MLIALGALLLIALAGAGYLARMYVLQKSATGQNKPSGDGA
jgi:hypothetical protein